MNKSPLSASQNARNMLRAATFSVRDAQSDLGRMNRKIRDDFGALRRWHSSEHQLLLRPRYCNPCQHLHLNRFESFS